MKQIIDWLFGQGSEFEAWQTAARAVAVFFIALRVGKDGDGNGDAAVLVPYRLNDGTADLQEVPASAVAS